MHTKILLLFFAVFSLSLSASIDQNSDQVIDSLMEDDNRLLYQLGIGVSFLLTLHETVSLIALRSEVASLANQLNEKENKINEQSKVIESQKQIIKKQNLTIIGLTLKNKGFEKAVTMQKNEIEKYRSFIERVNVTISSLEVAKTLPKEAIEIAIKEQKDKITTQEVEILRLKEIVKTMSKTITKQNNTISGLEMSKNLLKIKVRKLKTKLNDSSEALKKSFEEMNKKIGDLGMFWLKYQILENYGHTVNLTKVFSSADTDCTMRKFRDKCSKIAPGVFIATEKSTGLKFGGFTKETFDNSLEFKKDPSAFTFSLSSMDKCVNADPAHAIYVKEWYFYTFNKDLLGFGKYDIWIQDDCLVQTSAIMVNQTYKCPGSNNRRYFYTYEDDPKLNSFEYYHVSVQ